jgi:hypothetical protein
MTERHTTRGRYYTPRSIEMVPGLVRKPGSGYRIRLDDYTGTAEMIVAAGLATMAQLPGQPGNPISRAAYRPLGVEPDKFAWCWTRAEGYMVIFRRMDGRYRVELTVSREEFERRERAAKIEEDEREAAAEADEQRRRHEANMIRRIERLGFADREASERWAEARALLLAQGWIEKAKASARAG